MPSIRHSCVGNLDQERINAGHTILPCRDCVFVECCRDLLWGFPDSCTVLETAVAVLRTTGPALGSQYIPCYSIVVSIFFSIIPIKPQP